MKLTIHVIDNFDEYETSLRMHEKDPDIYPVCDMEITYQEANFADELILGYRVIEARDCKYGVKSVLIYTTVEEFSVDYTEEVIGELDYILDVKNSYFTKGEY